MREDDSYAKQTLGSWTTASPAQSVPNQQVSTTTPIQKFFGAILSTFVTKGLFFTLQKFPKDSLSGLFLVMETPEKLPRTPASGNATSISAFYLMRINNGIMYVCSA